MDCPYVWSQAAWNGQTFQMFKNSINVKVIGKKSILLKIVLDFIA